jgi:hypothetical protein
MPQEDNSLLITPFEDAPSTIGNPAHEVSPGRLITSAALIGAGVLVEPELLGGALIGAGVLYVLPFVGQILRPMVTMAMRYGYSAAASVGEVVAGASHQVQSIVADARTQYEQSEKSRI